MKPLPKKHEVVQTPLPVTPYSVQHPEHEASPCRWHADDNPAGGERQQHPHQAGHQRVRQQDRDVQRDPHQADGEAVLRGLSQGRLPASGTPPLGRAGLRGTVQECFIQTLPRCLGSSSCGQRLSRALQALELSFRAQCTPSSGMAGSSGGCSPSPVLPC